MAKFFVGQRVRLVRPDLGSAERHLPAGAEGVIYERGELVDWIVKFPGRRNPKRSGCCDEFPMWARELEPILGQQYEACDEDFKRDLDKLLEGISA